MTPNYYTLKFNNRAHAEAICRSLGYWDDASNGPITDGQINGPDGIRGFSIFEIGQNPKGLTGYFVNVAGKLPEAVAPCQVPYGCAGIVFAGTQPV